MTAYTQSGYPVIPAYGDPQLIPNPRVPGTAASQILGGLRKGPVATVLLYYASRFNAEVEPLGPGGKGGDDWGYAPRDIRGGTGWSNHAGGCAIDLNSTEHPQHRRGTFTSRQYSRMRQIAHDLQAAVGGRQVLRLGIDWNDTSVDEMHVEIAPNLAGTGVVEAAAAWIAKQGNNPTVQEDDMGFTEEQLRKIIREEVDTAIRSITVDTTDYSVRPPKPRKGRNIPALLGDVSNFASGAAYNAGQASTAAKAALAELQEGMKA